MATFLPGVTDVFPGPAPFEPNFQFIDTMLRRRQSMYEQGYSQVSAAYKALNRNLTNPMNAQSRDGFLRQAETNLKDLSAMDLSLPQNVDAATHVFKPFYQNTDILADMSLTSHWDQQESIASMYRTKDGGKEYNEDNINYVRQQRNKYAQDNPSNWRGYMQEKRSYTPYYDWNKEFVDYMKVYKPDSVSIKRRNGMYNVVEENKGATAEDLKLFFSGVASDKAKEQMRISAMVRIGDNAEAVAPYYKRVMEREINTYNNQLNNLDTQIKLAPDKQTRDQLSEQRKQVADAITERQSDVDKIKKGDVEFLRANAPKIAFALYFDDAVSKLANGLSWKDYKYDFDGDDVAMMYFKNAEDWKRTIFTADRADRRALMKAQQKAEKEKTEKEPKGIMDPVGYVNLPASNNPAVGGTTVSGLREQIDANNKQLTDASVLLRNYVANRLQRDPKTITAQDILAYGKSQNGAIDTEYHNYKKTITNVALKNDIIEHQVKAARDNARRSVGEQVYQNIESNLKTLDPLGKQAGITGEEMYHAVVNGTVELSTQQPVNTGPGTPSSGSGTRIMTINGKRYVASKDLVKMYESTRNYAAKPATKKYNESFTATINQSARVIGKGLVLSPLDSRFKYTAAGIAALTDQDATKITGLLYGGKKDVWFGLDSDAAKKDWEGESSRIKTILEAKGVKVIVDNNIKQIYIKEIPGTSSLNLGLDIYSGFTEAEQELINFGETVAGNGYQSPHFSPGGKIVDKFGTKIESFFYRVTENNGQKIFTLHNDLSKNDVVLAQSRSLPDLLKQANTIADTFTSFQEKYIQTYKGQ